jgi:hypothetical protein
MNTIYLASNNTVQLGGVTLSTGETVDDASVVFTLYDRDGAEVQGQVWPTTLSNTGNAGEYQGTLEATLEVKHNWTYKGVCKAITQEGVEMQITCKMLAKDRTCCE